MSQESGNQPLGTADLLAAGDRAKVVPVRERTQDVQRGEPATAADLRQDLSAGARQEMRPDGQHEAGADARRADPGPGQQGQSRPAAGMQEELAALFDPESTQRLRGRWSEVQSGFVDDPRQAVKHADELVAEVMQSLAQSFARQRAGIEAGVGGEEQASTENLRLALRRYRSFFERLLTL